MSRKFGERINEFVLSIDIMDQDTFDDLLDLIKEYVSEHLDVIYFSILFVGPLGNNDNGILKTKWSNREEKRDYPVNKEEGYTSHCAYTFGENKPIWVVSDSKEALKGADDLNSKWDDADDVKDLPAYNTLNDEVILTSVMHPLKNEGRTIGVVEFAANKYIDPTTASIKEIRQLAMIIGRAYLMYEARKAQRENTKEAKKMLQKSLKSQDWERLTLPKLFVAYPGVKRIEPERLVEHKLIIDAIKGVLEEYKNILTIADWDETADPGKISDKVISDISSSDFGLCYFSEPNKEGQFQDNANVLFEAGMMQALTNSMSAQFKAWLPVREEKSPSIPFDIVDERILIVDRKDGKFEKGEFTTELKKRVDALIDISDEEKTKD